MKDLVKPITYCGVRKISKYAYDSLAVEHAKESLLLDILKNIKNELPVEFYERVDKNGFVDLNVDLNGYFIRKPKNKEEIEFLIKFLENYVDYLRNELFSIENKVTYESGGV